MSDINNCIFCQIIAGKIPSKIVYQDENLVAIEDINPIAPVHLLLIPREHIASLNEANDEHQKVLGQIQLKAAKIAKEMDIDQSGYRLINNCGEWAGQLVMHLHYHLMGGRKMSWPAG